MPHRALFILLLLGMPGQALAQGRGERPEPTPRLDVAVTYITTAADGTQGGMRIAFHLASGSFRVEPAASLDGAPPIYILARRGQDRAVMVMESREAFLELEAGANMLRDLELALASGRASRVGTGRVANLPCTTWRLPEPALGEACISQRGVLLRRQTPAGLVMEASFVDLREQDPERFRVPPGFRAISIDDMVETPR